MRLKDIRAVRGPGTRIESSLENAKNCQPCQKDVQLTGTPTLDDVMSLIGVLLLDTTVIPAPGQIGPTPPKVWSCTKYRTVLKAVNLSCANYLDAQIAKFPRHVIHGLDGSGGVIVAKIHDRHHRARSGRLRAPFLGVLEPTKTATHPDSPSIDSADGEPGSYKSLEIHLTHPIRLSQLGIYYWAKNKLPGTLASQLPPHRLSYCITILTIYQTPSWTEAPDKKHLVGNDRGLEILPEPVAEAMLDLCENPKYSNGTILEVMNDHRRVVPLFNADSPPPKADMPALVTITTDLLEKLKKDRLDA
ncbi:hypothetical protein CHU98_g658 [Xylaria longipes]|nr:hypothetical protein CHU98_g658 [Xylaria longipes]